MDATSPIFTVDAAAAGVPVAAALVAVAAAVEVAGALVAVAAPAFATAVAVLSALLFPPPHPAAKTAPTAAIMAREVRYPRILRDIVFMAPSLLYLPGASSLKRSITA